MGRINDDDEELRKLHRRLNTYYFFLFVALALMGYGFYSLVMDLVYR